MAKHKTGLHKEVASIFDGVPIRKKKDARQASPALSPNRLGYEGRHEHNKEQSGTAAAPKSSAPAPKIPKAPEYQQPKPLMPKAIPTEQPKVVTPTVSGIQTSWQRACRQIKDKLFASKPGVNDGRQKTMVVLVPVLFVVFIIVFIKVLMPITGKAQASAKPGPSNAVTGSDNKIDWQIPAPYPTNLRDPMQFGSVTTVSAGTGTETPQLIVKAIVYSEDNPSAVIGKQIVHEGDEISGATIVKINKDGVEFEMNGERWKQKVQ